jgi:CheY-like chemotaxis protein
MKSSKIAVIVEDNEPTRRLICTALGSIGITEVITAENGQKAIEALAANKADIAIVDWMMDVMDGIEFTKKVRGSHAGIDPNIPILRLIAMRQVTLPSRITRHAFRSQRPLSPFSPVGADASS